MKTLRIISFIALGALLLALWPVVTEGQVSAPTPVSIPIFLGDYTGRTPTDSGTTYIWFRNMKGHSVKACVYDTLSDGRATLDSLLLGREQRLLFTVVDTSTVSTVYRRAVVRWGDYNYHSGHQDTLMLHADLTTTQVFDWPYTGVSMVFYDADSVDVGDKFMVTMLRNVYH